MIPGFYPFWFWNDRIDREGIEHQLEAMAAQGIRGVFVHSRHGLQQPYLGHEFFELLRHAIVHARSLGIKVQLYDEFPYPSGAAGGAVVQEHPELAASRLTLTRRRAAGHVHLMLPAGRTLGCIAVPVQHGELAWDSRIDLFGDLGMHFSRESFYDASPQDYNDRRFFADRPQPTLDTELPPGEHEVMALSLVPWVDHKYWGTFPDVLNPLATGRFLELTHERYARELGDLLAEVGSIFTDEVEPLRTGALVAAFTDQHGESTFMALLAATVPEHPEHPAARRELETLTYSLFTERFEKPIARWCADHGIAYLGEKPSMRLRQLALMDVPGCEPGHTKAGAPLDLVSYEIRSNALATSSAAYSYAKAGALCECFHSIGWGATLQDAKLIAEGLVALGIRYLVPHAFFYSTRALRKHDAPPSFFHMPYWPLFGSLTSRVHAMLDTLAGSWIAASIAVLEPSDGLPNEAQQHAYEELLHELLAQQLEVIILDTDMIEADADHGGPLVVRELSIETLVIPPITALRPETEAALARRVANGLHVVRLHDSKELAGTVGTLALARPPRLRITSNGSSLYRLVCTHFEDRAGHHRYLLVNTGTEPLGLLLQAPESLRAVELPGAPARLAGAEKNACLSLEAFESAMVEEGASAATVEAVRVRLPLRERLTQRRLSPNLCRLGRWHLSLAGGGSAEVEPLPLANQLRQAGLAFVPVIEDHFGGAPTIDFPPLEVRYSVAFETADARTVSLAMQRGALVGRARIEVDGVALDLDAPFALTLGITDAVGWQLPLDPERELHRIVVELHEAGPGDGLVDALYLAGEFSVFSPSRPRTQEDVPILGRLSAPLRFGSPGDLAAAGLPFYAGAVEWSGALGDLGRTASEAQVEVELDLPPHFCDAAELSFGSSPWHEVACSPRRVVIAAEELAETAVFHLRTYTTLAPTFEGRVFDVVAHRYRAVELAPAPITQGRGRDDEHPAS